jgi:serine/threonine-protein kinase
MAPNLPNDVERDQRLDAVVAAYVKAIESGQPPDCQELLARYPDLAAELTVFFADHDHVDQWAAPLRAAQAALAPTPPPDDTLFPSPGKNAADDPHAQPEVRSFGDYELLDKVSQGGMGVVYKARRRTLNRVVALKMIRGKCVDSPADLQRFQVESETAARLDHPNIVPVYDVGVCEGQPYFSMKLVEGGSLKENLARFHADFRGAARLLADVARAIHHAHQHGVLHRDLKPANIVLDAGNHPYVTDFGLAKLLASSQGLTHSGEIVGTPAYMAPEQASGQKGAGTTASDVYGLGAILYEVLTGRTPFQGDTVYYLLEQIRTREPEKPRRLNPRVDRDLETICLKCLEKEPGRRYASAAALAEDLERWLAGEPIQARPLSRLARMWRWSRRHKAAMAVAVAVFAAASITAGTGLWWAQKRSEAEWAVAGYVQQAKLLQEQGRWDEASQVLARAEERLAGGGLAGLLERVRRLRDEAAWVNELEDARLRAAESGMDRSFVSDFIGADRAYQAAFGQRGLDFDTLDPEEAAARIRAFGVRTRLSEALDVWADIKRRLRAGSEEHLRAVADTADDDPWCRRLRRLAGRMNRVGLEQLAAEDNALVQSASNLVLLGRALRAAGGQVAAEQLLRRAQQLHPEDFWINFELGYLLAMGDDLPSDRIEEAIGFHRVAQALRPQSPMVHNNLGVVLGQRGKWPEAEVAFRKAVALKPDYAQAYYNLGSALREQGKLVEAVEEYRKAIALRTDFPEAHCNLGAVLRGQGELAEAVEELQKAIALRPDLFEAHANLGMTLKDQGKLGEAEAACRKAIALNPDESGVHTNLGVVLMEQGRLGEAEAAARKAIALKPGYSKAFYILGCSLLAQEKLLEAEAAFRKASVLKPDHPEAHCNLGHALRDQGRFLDGLAALKRGHDLGSRNPRWPYPSAQWVHQCERLLQLDGKLPAILSGKEQPADAAERIALAELCQLSCKKRYASAALLYDEAFAAEPERASDRPSDPRYNAACAAALAGCGQGVDADSLDPSARARLRQQALGWLGADLAAWRNVLEGDRSKAAPAVRWQMRHWQKDTDFAGVRGTQALSRLPEDERRAWQKLWADVEELFVQAGEKTSAPEK